MEKGSFTRGILFMLLSATGLAFTGFLGKIGLMSLSLSSLSFWRFFTSFLLCAVLFGCTGRLKQSLHTGKFKMHLLRAFFALSAQYSFYYYIETNSVLNGIVLLNTGPMFIPIIEWAILHAKVGKSSWIGTIVSFFGMLLVLQPDRNIVSLTSFVGLFAGFSQGASQVLFGLGARAERTESQQFYLLLLCTIFSLLFYLVSETPHVPVGAQIDWVLLFLAIASVINLLARAAAYKHGTPTRLAPFLYISILVAGLLDWTRFGTLPNTLSLVGAALVVLGGVLKIYLRAKFLQRGKSG